MNWGEMAPGTGTEALGVIEAGGFTGELMVEALGLSWLLSGDWLRFDTSSEIVAHLS